MGQSVGQFLQMIRIIISLAGRLQIGRCSQTTFANDLDHPNEAAKCKEDGQVSDNFFVNDLDHPNEPAKCKGDRQVSNNFFVNDQDQPNEPAQCKEGGPVS